MDREIEEIALRGVRLAVGSGDKDKIANSCRQLFYLYSEFNHPDTRAAGYKSLAAAVNAYGQSTAEVGEEIAMLSVFHEYNNEHDQALKLRDASIKIFEKESSTKRIFEALEMAICSASDHGRGDKVEEYARCGIRVVKERCKIGSDEYTDNMDYFEQMLDTAYDPPVPIEEQRRQLFSMFPKLQKMVESMR